MLKTLLCKLVGHSWENWSLERKKCLQRRTCKRCGEKEKREVDHQWSEWVLSKKACLETRTCAHCKTQESREADHQWSDWKMVAGQCLETRKCLHCGEEFDLQLDHEFGSWQEMEDGNQYRLCQRCNHKEVKYLHCPHRFETVSETSEYNSYEREWMTYRTVRCVLCGKEEGKFVY